MLASTDQRVAAAAAVFAAGASILISFTMLRRRKPRQLLPASNPQHSRNQRKLKRSSSYMRASLGDTPQKFVFQHTAIADAETGTTDTMCLVFVGIPGRGKTTIANRTAAYLRFFHGLDCEVFDVASHRRNSVGYMTEQYYNDESADDLVRRAVYRREALDKLKEFLIKGQRRIAIFDSSNVTRDRRLEVYTEIKKLGKVDVIFVEIISQETMIHEEEMAERDKEGSGAIDNVEDYRKRVEHYQKVYEPIASCPSEDDHESEFSYIKCIDHGTKTIMNKIEGYMPGRIAQFITNCCHCH